jgi:hypothetical protein
MLRRFLFQSSGISLLALFMAMLVGCTYLTTPTPGMENMQPSFGGVVAEWIQQAVQPVCQGAESCQIDPAGQACQTYRQCLTGQMLQGGPLAQPGSTEGSSAGPPVACTISVTDDPPQNEEEERQKARCPYCQGPVIRKRSPTTFEKFHLWQYHCPTHGDISGLQWPNPAPWKWR